MRKVHIVLDTTEKEILNILIDFYSREYDIYTCDDLDQAYCHIPEKAICIPLSFREDTDYSDIFDFLHEVGHLKTNTVYMFRCRQEYLATQWAINACKRWEIPIVKEDRRYQPYIFKFRRKESFMGLRRVPSKAELTLRW